MIQQTTISNLEECLRKKDSENEHLKSKVIDFTTVQNLRAQVKELQSENELLKSKVIDCTMYKNLQVQVEELKSVNESLNLTIEELSKARALAEATLRERDEMINAQCKKIRLLDEQSETFYESWWRIRVRSGSVNRLTKSKHILPTDEDYNMEKLARLYIREIATDGQSEQTIQRIEDMLDLSKFWKMLVQSFYDSYYSSLFTLVRYAFTFNLTVKLNRVD
ncbi:hypothetical protein Tco_1576814 [Tanacetum coccineum]